MSGSGAEAGGVTLSLTVTNFAPIGLLDSILSVIFRPQTTPRAQEPRYFATGDSLRSFTLKMKKPDQGLYFALSDSSSVCSTSCGMRSLWWHRAKSFSLTAFPYCSTWPTPLSGLPLSFAISRGGFSSIPCASNTCQDVSQCCDRGLSGEKCTKKCYDPNSGKVGAWWMNGAPRSPNGSCVKCLPN